MRTPSYEQSSLKVGMLQLLQHTYFKADRVKPNHGVKSNERVVKCSRAKFKWEEVKCRKV